MLVEITDLLATGQIDPIIDSVIPFTQASQAHTLLQEGSVKGKLILSF